MKGFSQTKEMQSATGCSKDRGFHPIFGPITKVVMREFASSLSVILGKRNHEVWSKREEGRHQYCGGMGEGTIGSEDIQHSTV